NPAAMLAIAQDSIDKEQQKCLDRLSHLVCRDISSFYPRDVILENTTDFLKIGAFSIRKQDNIVAEPTFNVHAPTAKLNMMRVLRALQLDKPILLEGNPGVGKTSLVTALAQLVGKSLVRINLSEQTDLMDLFGSDVPVEGADA